MNKFFILISKTIFSYQIYFEIKPQISIDLLLDQAKSRADNEEAVLNLQTLLIITY